MMKALFVDTLFWVALTKETDPMYEKATSLLPLFSRCNVVTTEEVLGELLTYFSKRGTFLRQRVVALVKELMTQTNMEIIPQSHDSFVKGLELFEQRPE